MRSRCTDAGLAPEREVQGRPSARQVADQQTDEPPCCHAHATDLYTRLPGHGASCGGSLRGWMLLAFGRWRH